MQLSTSKLKALRQNKNWSQEVLATASGLSLRTIQRLESSGRVSAESFLCIAAALDAAPSQLKAEDEDIQATWTGEMIIKAIATILIIKFIVLGMVWMSGNFTDFANSPSILFIVIFTLSVTVLSHGSQGLIASLKGLKYVFTEELVGGKNAIYLANIYSAAVLFLMGCTAILQQAVNANTPLHVGSMAGMAVNLLPFLYATLISEALLFPLESKLRNADSVPL
jgi:transcriptional regulator with XRE-family HTH domain